MRGVKWSIINDQTWHMHTSCTHNEHTLHTSCAHLAHILRTPCAHLAHILHKSCTHLEHILSTYLAHFDNPAHLQTVFSFFLFSVTCSCAFPSSFWWFWPLCFYLFIIFHHLLYLSQGKVRGWADKRTPGSFSNWEEGWWWLECFISMHNIFYSRRTIPYCH